jgi:hypothetical protein
VIGDVIEDDPGYLRAALEKPSRELLVALTMFSRSAGVARDALLRSICDELRAAALSGRLTTAEELDTLVAALEVDCVTERPQHRQIAGDLASRWPAAFEDRTVEEAKLKAIARFAESARAIAEYPRSGAAPAYRELYEIAVKDLAYRVRLAAAQELGAGGDAAYEALAGTASGDEELVSYLEPPTEREWQDNNAHREFAMRAWLAPMLVGSTDQCEREARANLATWLERVGHEGDGGQRRFPLSLEVALGQGFKHAANRRPQQPNARVQPSGHLAEKAAEMLEAARFWFTRVTLVQALCLWALPDMPDRHGARAIRRTQEENSRRIRRRRREPQRRAADASALVGHWLASTSGGREHPFVAEARELAILALEKRQPERFLWIDESGVVTKIGARPPRSDTIRKHNLWIPPSVGWSALHPRAQKLVADVLLLLNLIEREGDPVERERRMRRATRDDLPPCLTGERAYLDPGKWWRPLPRRTARWQGALPGDLKRFWREMEERARR